MLKQNIIFMKIYYSDACLRHQTPEGHPERPARLRRLCETLTTPEWKDRLEWVKTPPVDLALLRLVHEPGYLDRLEAIAEVVAEKGPRPVDSGDTWISVGSLEAARCAVGGAVAAVDAVFAEDAEETTAFVMTRPPGHHARPGAAMGFCLYGTVAVAARHAQRVHGVERVLIVDWDVHHGNGTQEIFYEDPSVLFFSIHESPHWPFSGSPEETGAGAGEGFTLNVPVAAESDGRTYARHFRERLIPAAQQFSPDLILISAGFDAHRRDPLGGVCLEGEDFGLLTRMVMDLGAGSAGGRVVSVLEGGYDLAGLSESVACHLRNLSSS